MPMIAMLIYICVKMDLKSWNDSQHFLARLYTNHVCIFNLRRAYCTQNTTWNLAPWRGTDIVSVYLAWWPNTCFHSVQGWLTWHKMKRLRGDKPTEAKVHFISAHLHPPDLTHFHPPKKDISTPQRAHFIPHWNFFERTKNYKIKSESGCVCSSGSGLGGGPPRAEPDHV